MQGIDNFCVPLVLMPRTSTEGTAELPCQWMGVSAPVLVLLEVLGQGYWGCDNRKGTRCPSEKHSQQGQREEEKVRSASWYTEVQESDLIWDRAGPFLCFWQVQAMLSFHHKGQNRCGSRIMGMLDLWAQALWYMRDTISVRARTGPEHIEQPLMVRAWLWVCVQEQQWNKANLTCDPLWAVFDE